ncbi:MAG: hypothetical protein MZV64_70995 [Ignavibacteriales bacterium]|nr:hypothetical protein [Ignavibacteriales bacterium]
MKRRPNLAPDGVAAHLNHPLLSEEIRFPRPRAIGTRTAGRNPGIGDPCPWAWKSIWGWETLPEDAAPRRLPP